MKQPRTPCFDVNKFRERVQEFIDVTYSSRNKAAGHMRVTITSLRRFLNGKGGPSRDLVRYFSPYVTDYEELDLVIYNAGADLIAALDQLVERKKKTWPCRYLSRSDLARDLLCQAIKREHALTNK